MALPPTGNRHRESGPLLGVARGGGNLGIATSFEYQLHPVWPIVLGGLLLYPMGGAVRRFPKDHTAMGNRDAEFVLWITPAWTDPSEFELHRSWTRRFWDAMKPFSTGRVYVNALETDADHEVRGAFSPEAYELLVALKNKYDPTNFFCLNQNIKPTAQQEERAA